MYDRCVASLSLALPEDILKRKWAGDLEGAVQAIDIRLQDELPQMLRDRLIVEKERIRRLPTQYPWKREEAIAKLTELVPDMTAEEFDRLELEGKIDFIYIRGEKHYFVRFHKTLVKSIPEMRARAGEHVSPDSPWLDPMIREIREKGVLSRRITMNLGVHLAEKSFVPGDYQIWMPFPARSAQQSDIRLLSGSPKLIAAEDAEARTAYFERSMDAWQDEELQVQYVSTIRYADPLHAPAPAQPLYPDALPVTEADLAEDGPFIRFTPFLRSLAQELAGDETDPARKAWKFYEFITRRVRYSFVRDYFQLEEIGEYCGINLKGDCGLQALMFINLCRLSGIPARWQSGLSIDGYDYTGSHDWAQFYLEGWGWLFADPSYGGGAWRAGSVERNEFYFGNIDPMRMAANRRFMARMEPTTRFFRFDPYDNQSGEVHRVGADLPFTGREVDETDTLADYETL